MRSRGFTLAEVLMVIAIFAIITTLAVVSFSGSRAKARDAKRKYNARQLVTALERYYLDNNNKYPLATTSGGISLLNDPSFHSAISPTYLPTTSILNAGGKTFKYVSSTDQVNYLQGWELEATSEQALGTQSVANNVGIYITGTSGVLDRTLGSSGAQDNALIFNGGNTAVVIRNSGGANGPYAIPQFSLSFWFKTDTVANPTGGMYGDGYSLAQASRALGSGNGWMTYLKCDGTKCNVVGLYQDLQYPGGAWPTTINPVSISTGSWYHVVLTYAQGTPSRLIVYVNGTASSPLDLVPFGGDTAPLYGDNDLNASNIEVGFGGNLDTPLFAAPFDGQMDDLRFYNTNIDQTRVGSLYNNGQGTASNPNEANLIGGWLLASAGPSPCPFPFQFPATADYSVTNNPGCVFNGGGFQVGGTVFPNNLTLNGVGPGGNRAFATYGPQ
jgi:prepilin-type N-terminal cleavage/methylation domain-containing protein